MSDYELMPLGMWCKKVAKESGLAAYQIAEGVLVLSCAVVSPAIYIGGAIYYKGIAGRSNCLLWAAWSKLKNWKDCEVICVRNSRGRRHWQVKLNDGRVFEWYAKGASQRSRLANLWYRGEMKKVSGK